MRARNTLAIALFLALGTGIAITGTRIAGHYRGTAVELGRVKLSHVDAATRDALRALPENVLATYYVSPRIEMPSHLRRLENRVTDLLEALRRASDGNFDYQILDPHERDQSEALLDDGQAQSNEEANYAARQGIAPFRVRSVSRDSWSEKTIWSSLTITYGAYPLAIINGLLPEHLPRLSATILAHLEQMEQPRQPIVALSAPAGFDSLAEELAKGALVERFQFESETSIPADSDLLIWIRPGSIDAAVLRELDRYLASGRSVVFAGSMQNVRAGALDSEGQFLPERFETTASDFDADALLEHFGMRPVPGLVCDKRSMVYRQGEGESEVATELPFLIRCIAPNQRFGLVLKGQPNGTLMFEAPTPFRLIPEQLQDRGWTPEVLAHTSDKTWVEALPTGTADATLLDPERGVMVSRQALITLLRPLDPWRGSVIGMASASCLRDDLLRAAGYAHRRLVDVLLRNLTSDERLVLHRADFALPEPLPEFNTAQRTWWRAGVVFLFPALLLAVAIFRGALGGRTGRSPQAGTKKARLAPRILLTLALGVLVVRLASGVALRADWTAGGLNQLAPATAELAAKTQDLGELRAELIQSRRVKLPPALRLATTRLNDLLADLERAGADIQLTRTFPGDLSSNEREDLQSEGIEPRRVTSREEGVTTVRTIYSTLRLSATVDGQQRVERIALPDVSAFEGLEFRVAFALWRLQTGRTPRIAFASDTPRLSPAEAHMDYQMKGLFAPIGEDPYSVARERLSDAGFEVSHINPRDPDFPSDFDALVWLQPRRDVSIMIDAMARYLHQGGRVLLCVQHFNLQARQYRGTNFQTVYWPQPQSPDIDRFWFPELGIDLVRKVLFDELKTRQQLETQVNRNASVRDYEEQASALPFLIRAATANFAPDSITNGIGDQSFIWGNHIEWDAERLKELGLSAEPLITSSSRSWVYDWSGGYLPEETLAGFPVEDAEKITRVPRSTLVARFSGSFPLPVEPIVVPEEGQPLSDRGLPERASAPGKLVLVGNSEMFKNKRLLGPEFRADYLLVNAVADLVLPPGLAAVAGRRRVPRGFDFLAGDEKSRWRAIVVAVGPLLLLGFGLLRFLWRRRSPNFDLSAGGEVS